MIRDFRVLFLCFVCLGLTACARTSLFPGVGEITDFEDMHIETPVLYEDSYFDDLVIRSFGNNTNAIYMLDDGNEALLSRIHLIRQAKKAIYIQTFIWHDDESGRYVIYELLKAARRGVDVKIMTDGITRSGNPAELAYFSKFEPNFEVRYYNPVVKEITPKARSLARKAFLNWKKFNQRMHNKIFVVDDQIGITGGRNYENNYFDRSTTKLFKDRDVLAVGPVVKEMTNSFAEYWGYSWSITAVDMTDIRQFVTKRPVEAYDGRDDFRLGTLFDVLDKEADDAEHIKNLFVDSAYEIVNEKVAFVYDMPGKNPTKHLRGGSAVAEALGVMFEGATKRIVMQTPYLVLDKKMRKGFRTHVKEHPHIDIFVSTNSLAATDNIYAYSFSYKYKKYYLKKIRMQIFEFKPQPGDVDELYSFPEEVSLAPDGFACIHAKTFVIDGKKVYVGSFNIDPRSVNLNTEVGLIFDDPVVAQFVEENIRKDGEPQNSWTVGKKKHVPLISHFSGLLAEVVGLVPIFDVWPFHYSACFEPKEEGVFLPFYHEDFYEHYRSVGSYPEAKYSDREIKVRLLKSFNKFAEPVV